MTFRTFRTTAILIGATQTALFADSDLDLAQQIAAVMAQGPSGKAHQRYAHAKGLVCEGTFRASPGAAAVSRAVHPNGDEVLVTVRFSDGAPNAQVADDSPDAAPRGMAVRYNVGRGTDIMAISHDGFVVGNGWPLPDPTGERFGIPWQAGAAGMPPNFLSEALKVRLAQAPVRFRLLLQIAESETRRATNPKFGRILARR